jgi:hypothetical protein
MSLPIEPGLQRRLHYGNIVNRRNMYRRNMYVFGTNFTNTINNYIENIDINNLNYDSGIDINDSSDVGLTLCELLEISRIMYKEKCNDEICCICLDNYFKNKIVRKLICEHVFHIGCIEKWLSENSNCPMCRRNFK